LLRPGPSQIQLPLVKKTSDDIVFWKYGPHLSSTDLIRRHTDTINPKPWNRLSPLKVCLNIPQCHSSCSCHVSITGFCYSSNFFFYTSSSSISETRKPIFVARAANSTKHNSVGPYLS
jgi:hypothetical protein